MDNTRASPHDPEAGGALMVAGIQLSIMLGATIGGVAFDTFGATTEFIGSAVVLVIGGMLAYTSMVTTASKL